MTSTESSKVTFERWWQDANVVDCRVCGVFEGGGAKGVLYSAALEGMLAERCWFDAVAGASAGAITATLVAAGMRPDQIKKQTHEALATLRSPTRLNGALRVRAGASLLNQDALLAWLRRMLAASGARRGAGATFDDLHKLTDIELNVVAVDLTRHQLVVFNHQLTPTCQVAEAVLASAAIPFAFEWLWLDVPGRKRGMIVDGGIAANFPSFVFTDRSFRDWAGLGDPPDPTRIVGFLLDEADGANDEPPLVYEHSKFLAGLGASRGLKFRPAKVTGTNRGTGQGSPSVVARLAKIVLFPLKILLWTLTQFFFNWFPWLLAFNSRRTTLGLTGNPSWPDSFDVHTKPSEGDGDTSTDGAAKDSVDPPRRPTSATRVARMLALWLDRIMIVTRAPGMFVGALVVITLALGAGLYRYGWQPLMDHLDDVVNSNVSIFGAIIGTIFFLGVISALLYAWIVLVVVFVTASFTHATTRNVGYGLAKTFLQGPGAPPWAGHHRDDHVIKLVVPRAMTTLNASLPDDLVACALKAAQDKTRSTMRAIRAQAHRNRTVALRDESSLISSGP